MRRAEISLRFAKEHDLQNVLELSKGIYDGYDYLPFVFHEWLKAPNKQVFLADLQGKAIGFLAATMIDSGRTILCHGFRIHQDYRGRGYSYQIMSGVIDRVRGIYPQASKVRFLSYTSNLQITSLAKRLNCKKFLEINEFQFYFNESNFVSLRNKYRDYKLELYELRGKDAVEFVLHRRRLDFVIPNNTFVVLKAPYEMLPANADFLFKDGDKMFTDVSAEELRKEVMPRSFSHGRMEALVKAQRWICNIYTKEQDAFKAHLIRQLMAAIEHLQSVERETCFLISCLKNLEFDPEDVVKDVLGLEEGTIVENNVEVLYEKYIE